MREASDTSVCLPLYRKARELMAQKQYEQALALLENGSKREAAALLNRIREYKDVEQIFANDEELRTIAFNLQSN